MLLLYIVNIGKLESTMVLRKAAASNNRDAEKLKNLMQPENKL